MFVCLPYYWLGQRKIRIQTTTRPLHVLPEIWQVNSTRRKLEEIELENTAKIHRAKRGISAPFVINEAEPAALSKEAHDDYTSSSEPEPESGKRWKPSRHRASTTTSSRRQSLRALRRERKAQNQLLHRSFPDAEITLTTQSRLSRALEPEREPAPALPTIVREEYFKQSHHRQRHDPVHRMPANPAHVFQQLNKKEVDSIPGAKAAMEAEWHK